MRAGLARRLASEKTQWLFVDRGSSAADARHRAMEFEPQRREGAKIVEPSSRREARRCGDGCQNSSGLVSWRESVELFWSMAGARVVAKERLSPDLQEWVDARRRHRLSHAHVAMARELGMNPGKMGKIDNHQQEPWKAPLPIFIETLYEKRFGRERPEVIRTIEEVMAARIAKKAAKKARKAEKKMLALPHSPRQETAAGE
jgi:hypothetical protein